MSVCLVHALWAVGAPAVRVRCGCFEWARDFREFVSEFVSEFVTSMSDFVTS